MANCHITRLYAAFFNLRRDAIRKIIISQQAMRSAMRLLPLGIVAFLNVSPALALDCTGLTPQPPKDTTQSFTGKLDASVDGLFAKLASVGTKVEGTYVEVAKNVLVNFPEADKLYMWERVLFLQCQLIGDANDLSSKEKLQMVTDLYPKIDSVPTVPGPSISNSGNGNVINQGTGNSVTVTTTTTK
ncbi:hypothetical protein [Mesorhizobium sp. M0715]|uniref:hypothetical protein n=1 Tax=Mesorhizobium sp. M0715 TaxID=2956990 RepID=UPI003336CBA0